jgi:DNA (cytosine-5)-methyltransferase 3A
MGINVLSLFDGMSCGRIALDRLGVDVDNYYSCEIDKSAITVSLKNYPDIIQLGDIYNVDFSKLPKIDLIIGGSPCTYWSISRGSKREISESGIGFDLFMQYKRALDICKPKYFLYENNYSIHKDIKWSITKKLGVRPILINSALVSAQQRNRLYWTNISRLIRQPKNKRIFLNDILESGVSWQDKSYCLTASYEGAVFWNTLARNQKSMVAEPVSHPVRLGHVGKGHQSQRIYSIKGKSVNIMSNGGGQGGVSGLYKIDLPNGDYHIRKLTPLECERLQTIPDNYTNHVAKTQRYRMIGNGWTVDVIVHILSYMKEFYNVK